MKNIIPILTSGIFVFLASCTSFRDAADVKEIVPVKMTITAESDTPEVADLRGLTVTVTCSDEGFKWEHEIDDEAPIIVPDLTPGVYQIGIGGKKTGTDEKEYYMNAMQSRITLVADGSFDFKVKGVRTSPIVFKEIFYSGTAKATSGNYNGDQFYEIYNNSDEVIYLDGLVLGDIHPATPGNVPNWTYPEWMPEAERSKYMYSRYLWKFPGNGEDYPLQPGESCVVAQKALNHGGPLFNPGTTSPNLYSADFELYTSATEGDQPAVNMEIFHYTRATVPAQWISTVTGGAYHIARIPDTATDYDPYTEGNKWRINIGTSVLDWYAIVPVEWVLDAVECGQDETKISGKRVPAILDAGMAWVGPAGSGNSVSRKKSDVVGIHGQIIFQDTNNSSNDFIMGADAMTAQIRRYDVGTPSWNHALQNQPQEKEDEVKNP